MPIDIQNLHIRSTVVHRAGDEAASAVPAEPSRKDQCAAAMREQLLAECKRMIRDALNQRQER